MDPQSLVQQLLRTEEFFNRGTACLQEEDSGFQPKPEMFTVATHFAHVANTIDWFIEGAFREGGFNLDFEAVAKKTMSVTSLSEARAWIERSFHQAREVTGSKTWEEWMTPLPPGPIMGEAPRLAIFGGIDDHTAHHRGALSVYSRLIGHVPAMPYM